MSVLSPESGICELDRSARQWNGVRILGGGRERKEDSVDPAVGIVLHKKVADAVSAGECAATIYYEAEAARASAID